MKINILNPLPPDIFKNRVMFRVIFIVLLALACFGVLLGVYAIIAETNYYKELETLSLGFFVGPSLFVAYFGEKLQAYKKLTPSQQKELSDLGRKHPEITLYCDLVAKGNRRLILAEYEACQAWAEEAAHK